jgi:hemerythrin
MKNILYIVWSDNNNVGIPIIDEQHRGIVSTINSLHYFMQTGHGNEIIKPTMIMLEQYVDIHFKTEEALMAEASYPDIEEHIVLHKELVGKTKKLSIDANRNKDSDMVLKFLKEWWLGHINKEDRRYTPFLRKLIDTKAL